MNPKIAFVGLGRMGANMARCLHDKGYPIGAVFDINETTAIQIADELNTQKASSLAEVTASADVIFTVVTDDSAMENIFFGKDSLLQNAEGKTFINCATLSPAIHHKVEKAAHDNGAETLEACMASSIPQARNGELFLIIAGFESTYRKHETLLSDLSIARHFVGKTGTAAQVKALVNMVMNINTAALAEGLGLAKALDIDLPMLCDIFRQTGAHSRVLETDAQDMIQRDHDCFFSAEHAAKDSAIAIELAKESNLNLPLAQATLKQYQTLINKGFGNQDKSAVAELTFPGRNT